MAAARDIVVVQGPGCGRAAFQTSFTTATQVAADQLDGIVHSDTVDMVVIDGIDGSDVAWVPQLVERLTTHYPDVPIGIVVPLDVVQGQGQHVPSPPDSASPSAANDTPTPDDLATPTAQPRLAVHITDVQPLDGAVMLMVEPGGMMTATTLVEHLTLVARTTAAVVGSTIPDPSQITESERRLLTQLAAATAQIDHLSAAAAPATGLGLGTDALSRGVQIVQITRNRVARDGVQTTARWLASRALAAAQGRPTDPHTRTGQVAASALPALATTAADTRAAPIPDVEPGTRGVLHRLSEALPATLFGVQLIVEQIPPDEVAAAVTTITATDATGLHHGIVDHGWKIVTALRCRGAHRAARKVLDHLSPFTHGAATRAPLVVTAAHLDLIQHRGPRGADRHTWIACLSPVVALSNRALAAGDHAEAADLMLITLDVLFDAEQHADITTPLVDDTKTWLEPLRSSDVLRLLHQPPGGPPRPPLPPDTPRHHVVVMVEHRSTTDPLVTTLQTHPDVDLYVVDRAAIEAGGACLQPSQLLVDQVVHAVTGQLPDVSDDLRAWLDWADTIIVDAPGPTAQWVTMVAATEPRMLVRVHDIDVMRPAFQLVTWARVDDLLVAGEHVRDLATATMPTVPDDLGVHVLPDPVDLQGFTTSKTAAADRTIAVVDWGSRVADPVWALEVLGHLRRSDPSWRLMLVGPGFVRPDTKADHHHRHLFDETIVRLDLTASIEQVDELDDLEEVLTAVGFILSSSRRDDFGVRVCQGAASGAVPVVRDWPMFHQSTGPRSWYPPEWVVDDVGAAARRILALADPRVRSITGSQARDVVVHTYDWPVVQHGWLDLVVPPTSA